MNPLLQQFLTEARDFLERIGERLLTLEEDPNDDAVLGDLFRLMHTLKGNSGLFDMPALTRLLHAAEDVLDRVRDHDIAMDSQLTDTLLATADLVSAMLDAVEDDGAIPDDLAARALTLADVLRARLKGLAVIEVEEGPSGLAIPADWTYLQSLSEEKRAALFAAGKPLLALRYQPEPECFFKGEDPVFLLRSLPGLEGFKVSPAQPWGPAEALDVYRANLAIDAVSSENVATLEEHIRYVADQCVLYPLPLLALALPSGATAERSAVEGDVFTTLKGSLARGDAETMQQAISAMLDMISPDLWLASALRWTGRLLEAGTDAGQLGHFVDAIAEGRLPDWTVLEGLAPSGSASAVVGDTQPLPVVKPAAGYDPIAVEIIMAQRGILTLAGGDAGERGRLQAVLHTLENIFMVASDRQAQAILKLAEAEAADKGTVAPLLSALDAILSSILSPEEDEEEAMSVTMPAHLASNDLPVIDDSLATADLPLQEKAAQERGADKSMRVLKVSQEKIDRLMDLIGEMVVAKNALPYLAMKAEDVFGSRELSREIKGQYSIINRIAEEMQDGIMQVRMMPVGAIFQRFPRLVRDVARSLDKRVRLTIEGEETEADKSIIETLSDPLIHILRNSLDHGIEKPDVRTAAGKPAEGRLTIRASQEGDRVLIEIEDDGKGIDPAIVKRKAVEKGLIDAHAAEQLADADAVMLVFAPGFSTAETVSNLSGRGVGMDVVKSSIEKIGGEVSLTSELGRGTRLVLSLPLSMSVSNVMMVTIADQNFGVPMDVVVETVRVKQSDIHVFKDQLATVLRGKIVPLYSSHQVLNTSEEPKPNEDGEYAVLVARLAGETIGLLVDGFAHTTDVILKPLDGPLSGLPGFAGSALLGDGSVLLVLNLKELI